MTFAPFLAKMLKLVMNFAPFLAKKFHLYWRRVLHFSLPKICTLVSPLLKGAEITLSLAKTLRSSKQFVFFVLLLSNGVTGDRSTETNDRISGCTNLLLIEKRNERPPELCFSICRFSELRDGGVYPPSATSRTISFSISNSFWY